ncbi:YaeQ family protein [Oscillochloris sp. ZM17-4]|uniref:YaeQ family protein n=1 Tax=Oscillochloris sp. ZM17-4 TaxID=2866714 RepID=UPI001C73455A|nr:YaeQ family protein [Oscillochloris sp. ZM17-4]MBX0326464.1 YaeQ family protein [Oscillochloris sp. ZM17-4]
MAQGATIYNLTIDLADMDRGVYEALELRVARHPSESAEYLITRVLAYCLEYTEGIAFTQGISAGDEPAVLVRDATGQVTAWIEVGLPDAERLHRGSKLSGRAVVYTHRDAVQLCAQLAGKKIYRAESIPIYTFDRGFIGGLSGGLDRRSALSISVTEGQIFAGIGDLSLRSAITAHQIA